MVICERCGSIQIVRAHTTVMERSYALLTGRRPFLCRRCGFRMRRNWSDADLQRSRVSIEPQSDSVPIADFADSNYHPRPPDQLDLSEIDSRVPQVATVPASPRLPVKRRKERKQRKERGVTRGRRVRAQRREILGGLAVAAIAMTAALLLMGSQCGRPRDEIADP